MKATISLARKLGIAIPKGVSKREASAPMRESVDKVSFFLPMPPSANEMNEIRNGIPRRSAKHRSWRKEAAQQILLIQKQGSVHGRYAIFILVSEGDTKMDLGNAEKCTSDLLQYCGVISNDRLARRILSEWDENKAMLSGIYVEINKRA